MTRLPLRRWWPRIQAWLMRMPWRLCPYCGDPFGAQEDSGTNHFPALLGGEDDQVILCPSCVADGLGCVDHAWFGRFHIPCAFAAKDDSFDAAVPDDQWPPQDRDPIDPPTVVFAAVADLLGPNHTAEDAVCLNTILNPQQPAGRHRADTEETTPVSTEPEREMDLVMPFVTVTSKHGPHDDESYVAGWEMGKLDTVLGLMPDSPLPATYNLTVRSDNQPQVELIAMKHGYSAIVTESDTEGWSYVELTKGDSL